jgi:hypothetical protein
VETIGDCYMVAGGLVQRDADGCRAVLQDEAVDPLHARRVMELAKALVAEAKKVGRAGLLLGLTAAPGRLPHNRGALVAQGQRGLDVCAQPQLTLFPPGARSGPHARLGPASAAAHRHALRPSHVRRGGRLHVLRLRLPPHRCAVQPA